MNGNPNPTIVAALTVLAAVCIGSTTFLIYVDKPFVAISSVMTTVVTALVVYAGIKMVGGRS